MPKKKSGQRKATKNNKRTKPTRAKAAARRGRKTAASRTTHNKTRRKIGGARGAVGTAGSIPLQQSGPGAQTAGQSGDIEGLSSVARANSESIEELAEEGQSFEAEVVAGVEEAEDADESKVTTHEVLEDDVPTEYDGDR